MLWLGYNSTKTKEQVLHVVIPLFISVVAWVVLAASFHFGSFHLLVQYFVLLVILASTAPGGVLWAWMTYQMKGTTAVVSIGIITTVGNLSGMVAPITVSAILVGMGSYTWVAVVAAVFGFLGCCGVLGMNVLMKCYPEVDIEDNMVMVTVRNGF